MLAEFDAPHDTPRGVEIASKLKGASFGYLGEGDRMVIYDAVALECDTFLTCDGKLAKNARHLRRELGITVITPLQYWDMLSPWAALYV